jgi:putative ABC transport system permease protein
MRPTDVLASAAGALLSNKLRSLLTVLGIIIGVAAVIGVMAVGQGTQATVSDRISGLGTDLIFVRPGAVTTQGVSQGQGSAQTLTLADAQAIAAPGAAPAVGGVAPELSTTVQLSVSGQNSRSRATGTSQDYPQVRGVSLAEGTFFTADDDASARAVVVLGASVAGTLFPDGGAVGSVIRVSTRPFTVVGVLASQGGTALGNLDDQVLLPITTAQRRLSAGRTVSGELVVNSITVQAADSKSIEAAKSQITALLRERHAIIGTEDDFTITTQEDLVATASQVADVFTIFLGSIAGISLLVGGIGIMNIMLVSVTERTREIGIRKAVGARYRDIMAQFLAEAILLSAVGGALGIGLGFGLAEVFGQLSLNGSQLRTVVTPGVVGLAVGVAVAIGLFFGLYPATQAARLDPIAALRHE